MKFFIDQYLLSCSYFVHCTVYAVFVYYVYIYIYYLTNVVAQIHRKTVHGHKTIYALTHCVV